MFFFYLQSDTYRPSKMSEMSDVVSSDLNMEPDLSADLDLALAAAAAAAAAAADTDGETNPPAEDAASPPPQTQEESDNAADLSLDLGGEDSWDHIMMDIYVSKRGGNSGNGGCVRDNCRISYSRFFATLKHENNHQGLLKKQFS